MWQFLVFSFNEECRTLSSLVWSWIQQSVALDLDKPNDLEEVMKSIRRCMPMELQKSRRVH